jgi:putative spermidine/putrescine transport system permease protein
MRVAYGAYDFGFEDEARTLGASLRAVSWQVRLPLLAPGLAAAAFLAFLVGWSDYIVTLLVGGGRFVTLPILVASAASGTGNEPTVAALSLSALLPPVVALAAAGALRRALAPRRARRAALPMPWDAFRRAVPTRGTT